jgi:hypothetical protein
LPRAIVLCLTFLFFPQIYGQQLGFANDSAEIIALKKASSNTKEYRKQLAEKYQKKGFLLASADSVAPDRILVSKGKYYDSVYVYWHSELGEQEFQTDVPGLLQYIEAYLTETENSGHPFSSVALSAAAQSDTLLAIKAKADPGEKYTLDTLMFKDLEMSKRFLKWAADIHIGDPYNQKAIKLLQYKLASVDGFAVYGEPVLRAVDKRMHVFIHAEKPIRDQLSGLVGLATVPNGRPVFTGEATGRFYNMFQAGVHAAFEWRSYKARSQELRISGSLPYLFGVPFNTRFQLAYEKFDTIYSAFTRGLHFRMPINKNSGLVVGASFTDRFRIYTDLSPVQQFRSLPENPPSRNSLYELGYEYRNMVPGKLNTRGWDLAANVGIGARRFVRDPEISGITWINAAGNKENIYDSLDRIGQLRATRYRISVKVQRYFEILPWLVLKTGLDAIQYRAPVIYFNELERFGGIKNLRGFNEQSIFASEFYMGTAELRFISGASGYLAPFYHFGWFKDGSNSTTPASGYVQGMGIQTAFRTAAGILNMAWALGKSGNQPLGLNQSRFHLGISSSF